MEIFAFKPFLRLVGFCFCCLIFVVLRIKPRVFYMLGKPSTPKLYPCPVFSLVLYCHACFDEICCPTKKVLIIRRQFYLAGTLHGSKVLLFGSKYRPDTVLTDLEMLDSFLIPFRSCFIGIPRMVLPVSVDQIKCVPMPSTSYEWI